MSLWVLSGFFPQTTDMHGVRLIGNSELSVVVSMNGCLCATDWGPDQGVAHLLLYDSWDSLQLSCQPSFTHACKYM